jgi:3-hydroxyisobutyrate dehydrogenase-like beta-hydroxyacid dehydrogenase
MGLKKQDLIDVIALGAINAPMFALKGPAMAKASYPPGRQGHNTWVVVMSHVM